MSVFPQLILLFVKIQRRNYFKRVKRKYKCVFLDRERWLVGDSKADILTRQKIECKTILIESKFNKKYIKKNKEMEADFISFGLKQAVVKIFQNN